MDNDGAALTHICMHRVVDYGELRCQSALMAMGGSSVEIGLRGRGISHAIQHTLAKGESQS